MHTPLIVTEAPPCAVHAVFILAQKNIIMDIHRPWDTDSSYLWGFPGFCWIYHAFKHHSCMVYNPIMHSNIIQTSFMYGVQPRPCI